MGRVIRGSMCADGMGCFPFHRTPRNEGIFKVDVHLKTYLYCFRSTRVTSAGYKMPFVYTWNK